MDPDDLRRSVHRAKNKMQEASSMLCCDRIGTGTFRDNVTDYATALWVHETFCRLYKANLPYKHSTTGRPVTVSSLDYVAAPERQKRGAWHIHYGFNVAHDVRLLRACWQLAQAKCGIENSDGAFNVRYRPEIKSKSAPRRIGGYLSKYLTKDFQGGDLYRKRYYTSKGIPQPSKTRMYFLRAHTTEELLNFVEKLLGVRICNSHWGKAGPYDIYYGKFEAT